MNFLILRVIWMFLIVFVCVDNGFVVIVSVRVIRASLMRIPYSS